MRLREPTISPFASASTDQGGSLGHATRTLEPRTEPRGATGGDLTTCRARGVAGAEGVRHLQVARLNWD
ncbi:hypothetical protein V6N12_059236 [Hibiscus sabdariffa]|uniref:Uncharacterized protein n=1 Tax=Hibiscus sabdariffa TaxID=183260 RepID=A0ABR2EXQ5_9ROSI